MEAKTFSYPVLIRESHLDTFGHVNNATYLNLLEEARWEWMTLNGYGMQKIQETQKGPTILELSVRFNKELRLREKVVIETRMTSYQKKIGRLEQKMMRDNEVCCTAEFVIGLFDLNERKLILPTEEWLKAVGVEKL